MSSLRLPGRLRTFSNPSATETDVSRNFRRRSVQSINNFSLRRMLCPEPAIHSRRSTTSLKDAEKSSSQVGPKNIPENDGRRRTNRGAITIPQPFSSRRRSHQDQQAIFIPAVAVHRAPHEPGSPISPLQYCHRDLASNKTVGSLSGTLSPSPSLTLVLQPLVLGQLQLPHNMGNNLSSKLRHRRKGSKSSGVSPEPEQSTIRPASSPVPGQPSSFRIIIPDRHSSISPQPSSPGKASSTRTIRPSDHKNPPRSSTAPGTKPSPEHHFTLPRSIASVISQPTQDTTTEKHSGASSPPHPPRGPARFPQFLTLTLPTPAPPLTLAHYACYHNHRRMHRSSNVHHPVPCMTCGAENGETRWKCQWCCLRICPYCMKRLTQNKGRDLEQLIRRLEHEGRRLVEGNGEEWANRKGRMWNDGHDGEGGGSSKGKGKEREPGYQYEPSTAKGKEREPGYRYDPSTVKGKEREPGYRYEQPIAKGKEKELGYPSEVSTAKGKGKEPAYQGGEASTAKTVVGIAAEGHGKENENHGGKETGMGTEKQDPEGTET